MHPSTLSPFRDFALDNVSAERSGAPALRFISVSFEANDMESVKRPPWTDI